jgi:hypothetical protein
MTLTTDEQETVLPLERYAEATAYLAHFRKADPAEVIERLGIEAGDFKAAQKAWTTAIGDELERQETTLALRLGEIFAPTRQRLGEAQPTLESVGPRASERVKPLAVVEKPVAIEPIRKTIPLPEPIALKEPEARPIVSLPLASPPAAIVPPPGMIAPPLIIATPPPANAHSPWSESTTASPPLREDLVPAGMRHFTSVVGTQLAPAAPSTPALPFVRGAPPGPSKPPASRALVPEGMRHFTSVTGTQGPIDAPSGPSLPFGLRPAAAAATEHAESPMALEEYTRLHVELARDPANRRAIVQRHGLDEPRLLRLDAYWGPRIKADAGLRAIWDSAYAAHRARLGRPEGPPR